MSSAKPKIWVRLVAGVLVGAAAATARAQMPLPVDGPAAPAPGQPSEARTALTQAIEKFRKGDYDGAAPLFRKAMTLQTQLTRAEQQDLQRMQMDNSAAVAARTLSSQSLHLAEKAVKDGHNGEAAAKLNFVAGHEKYLTPADHQLYVKLQAQIRGPSSGPSAPAANNVAQAHLKAQQARALFNIFNFEAAHTLAMEADHMGVVFGPSEDSPKHIMDDIKAAMIDSKMLLAASRSALNRNEFNQAETYAKLSDQHSGVLTFPLWASDTPAKALKDIEAARKQSASARPPANPVKPPQNQQPRADVGRPVASPPQPPASEIKLASHTTEAPATGEVSPAAMLMQARKALLDGDLKRARTLAEQVRAKVMKTPLQADADKLLADIAKAEAIPRPAPLSAKKPMPKVTTKEEAIALLRDGRTQLANGKYEEAGAIAQHLKTMTQFTWGYFEDNPGKLLVDADRVRIRHDREESVKVLAQARQMFEKGDYDGATRLAHKARILHGPYGMLDFGDDPTKLLAEIETAKAKDHKVELGKPQNLAGSNQSAAPPANELPEAKARRLLAEARAALKKNELDKAEKLRDQVVELHVALNKPGDDSPAALTLDITAARVKNPQAAMGKPEPPKPGTGNDYPPVINTSLPPAPLGPVGQVPPLPDTSDPASLPAPVPSLPDPNKIQARKLLADARQLQRAGKLIEAYQKAQEAQKLHASFRQDEETPDMLVQQLCGVARKRIESLVRSADETLHSGTSDPKLRDPMARYQVVEEELVEAMKLVTAFRQDPETVQTKLDTIRQMRNLALAAKAQPDNGVPTPPIPPIPPVPPVPNPITPVVALVPAPPDKGKELLDKARLELRSGATATARHLVEEALTGNYGVQEEAQNLLRSIDAEESSQRMLQHRHTFDAAAQAYNRNDYSHAMALLATVDIGLLDPTRATNFRELMQNPAMSAKNPDRALPATAVNTAGPQEVAQADVRSGASEAEPGHSRATDGPAQQLLESQEALREINFQKLRQNGLDAQREANDKFKTGQTAAAIDALQEYLKELDNEGLAPNQMAMLRRPIEARLRFFTLMKTRGDEEAHIDDANHEVRTRRDKVALAEENTEKQIKELLDQCRALDKQKKYEEEHALALRAQALDPENPSVYAYVHMSETALAQQIADRNKKTRADNGGAALDQAEEGVPTDAIKTGFYVDPKYWTKNVEGRKVPNSVLPRRNPKDREVESQLFTPVSVNWQSTPLRQVIDDLRNLYGLNIFPDEPALLAHGTSLDRPVSIKLDQISLRVVLELMLKNLDLVYVIESGVVQITTADHAKGRMEVGTHYVADLVISVPNFGQMPANGQPLPLPKLVPDPMPYGAPTPIQPAGSMTNGASVGSAMGSPFASQQSASGDHNWQSSVAAPSGTQEKELIQIIKQVIAPQTWADMGGPGTIDYHAATLSLVINQTPDIQEQVADLLAALRRLQDQEVSVEVRFISIADDFYEHIGVNFSASIQTHNQQFEPQLTTGQFAPVPFINTFLPNNFLAGATPAGTLTNDLSIPITNNTFFQTLPQIGGYPGLGVGGLSMGLAFLSDIQMFLYLEAVQGDNRTHITQAPKLTLFNGQTATLSVQTSETFLTQIQLIPNIGNGNPIFVPQQQAVPVGVQLTLQAVITADRRFVRLSLNPTLSVFTPGPVMTFPVVVPLFPGVQIDGVSPNPVTLTQLMQQPSVQTINVATTVLVPDGGTVLMGGLKRLSEARAEAGPPILSNIPILDRLFRNVGFGRETESLLLMVTPRIIIQEEEEFRQTGFVKPENP